VAAAHPATRAIFERYDIPWRDSPAPFWEPIVQAAAARGYGPAATARLLAELNEAVIHEGHEEHEEELPRPSSSSDSPHSPA
jgi:hypothetical protein